MRRIWALLIIAFVAVASHVYAEDTLVEKDFTIRGPLKLRLAFPSSFQVTNVASEAPTPPSVTVKFTSKAQKDFVMLFTTIPNPEGRYAIKDLDQLRKLVEKSGQGPLRSSVESKLNLIEIQGPQAKGYYFSLTDITVPEKPKPGEYKYMTQGIVLLGDVMVNFTIVSNTAEIPEKAQGIEIVRSARYIKGETK